MFLALELTQEKNEKILQALSTSVMLWSAAENIWLMDLRPFVSYWQLRAQAARLPLASLLRKVLQQALPSLLEQRQDILELSPSFRAACAPSPWQALLLLLSLRERKTKACVFWEQDFARTLYRELTWSVWWQAIEQVGPHLIKKEQKIFGQSVQRLAAAVERLGFVSVQHMKVLNFAGMRRRFGKWCAEAWQWTFAQEAGNAGLFSTFPWQNFILTQPIEIVRYLECPVALWEQIAPLLSEDLDRLCEQSQWAQDAQVTKLHWKVTFDDLAILSIPIEFRHPHDLRKQKGAHQTTLLQAYYSFKQRITDLLDGDPPYPLVLSWRLQLTETLVIASWVKDLFGELAENTDQDLLQLENELAIPLQRFADREDWVPEASFAPQAHFPAPAEHVSCRLLARRRPLFLYKEVQSCVLGGQKPIFLENTMAKWWLQPEDGAWQRQYYKRVDEKNQAFWVYQDSTGRWVTHGNYG